MTTHLVANGAPHGPETSRRWRKLTASRDRLAVMGIAGEVSAALVGMLSRWLYAPLAVSDVAAIIFSAWASGAIGSFGAAGTAAQATLRRSRRAVTDPLVVVAAIASRAGVGVIIGLANSAKGATQDLSPGLAS